MAGCTRRPDEQDVSELPAGAGEQGGFGRRVSGRFPGADGGLVGGSSEPGGAGRGLRDAHARPQPRAAAAGSSTRGLGSSKEEEENRDGRAQQLPA